MARSIQTIYQQMLDEKAKYASLNSLTNTRNTSIWRSIYYSIAVSISIFEQLNDVFKTELLQTAETLPVGTRYWYAQKTLEYQEGYSLFYSRETGKLEYPKIDEESKLIAATSCTNESDNIIIKACKYTDENKNELTNLTNDEYNAVNNYINDLKFAGVVTKLVSLPGDLLRLNISIKIDKSKINSSGQLVSDNTIYPVEDAINNYLLNFAISNFDDEFDLQLLINEIQSIDGVKNVNVTLCQAKPTTGTEFLDILTTEFLTYKSSAGYLKIDQTYPLVDHITYI